MGRDLLFSVTAQDCRFDYSRGTGKGGQKRNKTSSHVRCTHVASGAVGQSDDTRSQHRNKRLAFRRMAQSPAFRQWLTMETARRTGTALEAEEAVARAMEDENLVVEIQESGRWRRE